MGIPVFYPFARRSFFPFSRSSCVAARFYHPFGQHFIPLSPRREVGGRGVDGCTGASAVGCGGTAWELSVVFSTGGGMGRLRVGRVNGGGRGRQSSPLRIPHFAPHRTGANVKRFRDVKADTRVAHLGSTTSNGYTGTHVWFEYSMIRQGHSDGNAVNRKIIAIASRRRRTGRQSRFLSARSLTRALRIARDTCLATVMCTLRREGGWSVQIHICKWDQEKRSSQSESRLAQSVSRCACCQGVIVARGGNPTIFDKSPAPDTGRELHLSVSKWETSEKRVRSIINKCLRQKSPTTRMKKSYFVFVSIKVFYRCCTCYIKRDYGAEWRKELFLPLWAHFFLFSIFSCVFSDRCHLGSDEKEVESPRTQARFMLVPTLVCFARKIKEHKYHFNLPMDVLHLFHFFLIVRTFEFGFWRSSCLFVTRHRCRPLRSKNGEINDVATWLSLFSFGGWRGMRSVGAREPTNVGFQAFRSALRYRATLAAANFARIIDFTSFACP